MEDNCNTYQCLLCDLCGNSPAELRNVHLQQPSKTGVHELALDKRTNEIYCSGCKDFVYSDEIDRVTMVSFSHGS